MGGERGWSGGTPGVPGEEPDRRSGLKTHAPLPDQGIAGDADAVVGGLVGVKGVVFGFGTEGLAFFVDDDFLFVEVLEEGVDPVGVLLGDL